MDTFKQRIRKYARFMRLLLANKTYIYIYIKKRRAYSVDEFLNLLVYLHPLFCKGFCLKCFENDVLLLDNGATKIKVDMRYPVIAWEIFAEHIYELPKAIVGDRTYSVLDIGANRGYSALYFASLEYVERVFSFELFPDIAKKAAENLALNPHLNSKIHFHNFGLGATEQTITAYYLPERDGISSAHLSFLEQYAPEERGHIQSQQCVVKPASLVLQDCIESNKLRHIMLKIDVEGAEYEIMRDLSSHYPQIFEYVGIIMGDTHSGFIALLDILRPYSYDVYMAQPHTNGTCPFILIKQGWLKG